MSGREKYEATPQFKTFMDACHEREAAHGTYELTREKYGIAHHNTRKARTKLVAAMTKVDDTLHVCRLTSEHKLAFGW